MLVNQICVQTSPEVRIDKVWMYKEIMMKDDNLESNLLTYSLLKMYVLSGTS